MYLQNYNSIAEQQNMLHANINIDAIILSIYCSSWMQFCPCRLEVYFLFFRFEGVLFGNGGGNWMLVHLHM